MPLFVCPSKVTVIATYRESACFRSLGSKPRWCALFRQRSGERVQPAQALGTNIFACQVELTSNVVVHNKRMPLLCFGGAEISSCSGSLRSNLASGSYPQRHNDVFVIVICIPGDPHLRTGIGVFEFERYADGRATFFRWSSTGSSTARII